MDHTFCRILLQQTMKEVRSKVSKETIKASWAYRYSGRMGAEFHVVSWPDKKTLYYWHGQACCMAHAKAQGWAEYLEVLGRQ